MPLRPKAGGMQGEMPAETNFGDPRSKYPSASEIPEVRIDSMEKPPEGSDNPVIGALKTLQEFVLAKEQQQNPQATAMKEALVGLMKSFMSAGEGMEGMPEEGGEQKPIFDPFKAPEDEEGMEEGGESPAMKKMGKNRSKTIQPLI